jgi:ribose 5-phosphate isomerase A
MDAKALDDLKRAAAQTAADMVQDGMVVGLGTGSTAKHLVAILGERVRQGLKFVGIPTSEATRLQAESLGIKIVGFADTQHIDITIDGADEIALGSLSLIKGGGGALLREKIVASASSKMVVISDETKVRDHLGGAFPLPVEIVPFGWEVAFGKLRDRCRRATLRQGKDGAPFVTDGGHYIVDCDFDTIADPAALERDIDTIVGVVESGLFVGIAAEALVAGAGGVKRLLPK